MNAHTDMVTSIVWLPDGSGFVSGGIDKKIIHWVRLFRPVALNLLTVFSTCIVGFGGKAKRTVGPCDHPDLRLGGCTRPVSFSHSGIHTAACTAGLRGRTGARRRECSGQRCYKWAEPGASDACIRLGIENDN